MGDYRKLSLGLLHHIFKNRLFVLHALVDAFPGRAVYIYSLNSFFHKISGERLYALRAYAALLVVACVKCRDNAFVLVKIPHDFYSFFFLNVLYLLIKHF